MCAATIICAMPAATAAQLGLHHLAVPLTTLLQGCDGESSCSAYESSAAYGGGKEPAGQPSAAIGVVRIMVAMRTTQSPVSGQSDSRGWSTGLHQHLWCRYLYLYPRDMNTNGPSILATSSSQIFHSFFVYTHEHILHLLEDQWGGKRKGLGASHNDLR